MSYNTKLNHSISIQIVPRFTHVSQVRNLSPKLIVNFSSKPRSFPQCFSMYNLIKVALTVRCLKDIVNGITIVTLLNTWLLHSLKLYLISKTYRVYLNRKQSKQSRVGYMFIFHSICTLSNILLDLYITLHSCRKWIMLHHVFW